MLVAGTFAVVQLLMGNTVEHMLTEHDSYHMCNNLTETENHRIYHLSNATKTCNDFKVEIVLTLSFLSGLIMVKAMVVVWVC